MQPSALRVEDFKSYPPQARALAAAYLPLLRRIPLALLPVILRQFVNFDWRFPIEQRGLQNKLRYLSALPASSLAEMMAPFDSVRLPETISQSNWVESPQLFSEHLSAALWSMQEQDQYHAAAAGFQQTLEANVKDEAPIAPRFTIVVLGQGVSHTQTRLFRLLRPSGVLFTAVRPANGVQSLIQFVNERAQKHPQPYGHWYIDGASPDAACDPQHGVTVTSYGGLAGLTKKIVELTGEFVSKAGANTTVSPTAVQSFLGSLAENQTSLHDGARDAVVRHFEIDILTGGAGTQVFSTTFVQWAAREAMRRAQPLTMFARYAPRQRVAPMNDLLARDASAQETDPEGSLIDADMGAYYTWINQRRLVGNEQASFLVWHEGQGLALAIAPSLPQGTESDKATDLPTILRWMS